MSGKMIYAGIFILNVLDLITTHLGVNLMGFQELNPVMRPIVGSWVIVPIKLGTALLVVHVFYRLNQKFPEWKFAINVTRGVLLFYSLVVINNLVNIVLG